MEADAQHTSIVHLLFKKCKLRQAFSRKKILKIRHISNMGQNRKLRTLFASASAGTVNHLGREQLLTTDVVDR